MKLLFTEGEISSKWCLRLKVSSAVQICELRSSGLILCFVKVKIAHSSLYISVKHM